MKNLLFFLLLLTSCVTRVPKSDPPGIEAPAPAVVTTSDTVYVPVAAVCNYDSLLRINDSLMVVTDTLAKRLLHARLVISNVKYYLNIAIRNPSQDKFLKGWIRRAVE